MENEKEFYTVPEVRKVLCLSKSTVYRYIKTGVIPSVKVGNKILVSRKIIEEFHEAAMKKRED